MPAICHLSKEQVNEITRVIMSAGMNPNAFNDLSLVERNFTGTERDAVRLEHRAGYSFDFAHGLAEMQWRAMDAMTRRLFSWNGGEHCAEYSPGPDAPKATVLQVPWDQIRDGHLPLWLKRVKAETESEDLWERFRQAGVNPSHLVATHILTADSAVGLDNVVALTAEENWKFGIGLRQVVERVEQQGLETPDQLADLRRRVEHLEQAAKTVPRRYLGELVFSAVVAHYIDAVLDSDHLQAVWRIVRHVIGPLLNGFLGGNGGGPPILPPYDGINV